MLKLCDMHFSINLLNKNKSKKIILAGTTFSTKQGKDNKTAKFPIFAYYFTSIALNVKYENWLIFQILNGKCQPL